MTPHSPRNSNALPGIRPRSLRAAEILWNLSVLVYLLFPNYEPLNVLIKSGFDFTGTSATICQTYLGVMRAIEAGAAAECSSTLFGSLAFGGVMLATILCFQFLLLRYRMRRRIDVLVSLLFLVGGLWIVSIVRSTGEIHMREWAAVGCLAIVLAGAITMCVSVHTLIFKKWRT